MIPTKTTGTAESWICRACSSTNAGWRLRCEHCGVLVGSASSSWGPPQQPWQQVPHPPPKTRSGAKRALAVVLSVAGGVFGYGAARLGLESYRSATDGRSAEERVDEYLRGDGDKEFFAADSQFRATFPTAPTRSVQAVDAVGTTVDTVVYTSTVGPTTFAVQTIDLTADLTYDLNMGVNGIAAALEGQVQSATFTTWQGFEALDALVDAPGLTVELRAIGTPRHVYLLAVISTSDPGPEFDKFTASFEIIV